MGGVLGREQFRVAAVERSAVQVREVGIASVLAAARGEVDLPRGIVDPDDVEDHAALGDLVLEFASFRVVQVELPGARALGVPERLGPVCGDVEVGPVVVPRRERVEMGLALLHDRAHGARVEVHGGDAIGLTAVVCRHEEEFVVRAPPQHIRREVKGREVLKAGRVDVRSNDAAGLRVDDRDLSRRRRLLPRHEHSVEVDGGEWQVGRQVLLDVGAHRHGAEVHAHRGEVPAVGRPVDRHDRRRFAGPAALDPVQFEAEVSVGETVLAIGGELRFLPGIQVPDPEVGGPDERRAGSVRRRAFRGRRRRRFVLRALRGIRRAGKHAARRGDMQAVTVQVERGDRQVVRVGLLESRVGKRCRQIGVIERRGLLAGRGIDHYETGPVAGLLLHPEPVLVPDPVGLRTKVRHEPHQRRGLELGGVLPGLVAVRRAAADGPDGNRRHGDRSCVRLHRAWSISREAARVPRRHPRTPTSGRPR